MRCCDCRFGVANPEEPDAAWENFDLGEGYEGECYRHPPGVDGVRPRVVFSDFCGEWRTRMKAEAGEWREARATQYWVVMRWPEEDMDGRPAFRVIITPPGRHSSRGIAYFTGDNVRVNTEHVRRSAYWTAVQSAILENQWGE